MTKWVNRKRNLIANQIRDLSNKLIIILHTTKKDLSIKLENKDNYLTIFPRNIKLKTIKSYKLYQKIVSWHNIIQKEFEEEKVKKETIDIFFKNYNKLKWRTLRLGTFELYHRFRYYEQKIKNKGLELISTFNDFINDILINNNSSSRFIFKAICNETYHPVIVNNFMYASSTVCRFCNYYTSYFDLKFTVEDNGYTLKTPSSEMQWIDMILNRKGTKIVNPAYMKITVICGIHGDFNTTYHDQQQKYGCAECGNEVNRLSINEIRKRGLFYGFTLKRSMTHKVIRHRLSKRQQLDWNCEKGHLVQALPFPSSLKNSYCEICSGGKITEERKIRYMLNRMFYINSKGAKPKNYYNIDRLKWKNIIQNKRVLDYISKHHINKTNYSHSHIDYLVENFKIQGKLKNGKVSEQKVFFTLEVWELHHKKGSKIYNPRIVEYDGLKQILYEEGFLDIHIVIKIYELSGRLYHDFIIKKLMRQLKEKFGIVELDMNIGNITYNRVLRHLKQNLDSKQYKLEKWM